MARTRPEPCCLHRTTHPQPPDACRCRRPCHRLWRRPVRPPKPPSLPATMASLKLPVVASARTTPPSETTETRADRHVVSIPCLRFTKWSSAASARPGRCGSPRCRPLVSTKSKRRQFREPVGLKTQTVQVAKTRLRKAFFDLRAQWGGQALGRGQPYPPQVLRLETQVAAAHLHGVGPDKEERHAGS